MKKFSFLTLGIVLLLAACSEGGSAKESENNGNTPDSAESAEKQVVTFWHSMGGAGQEALNNIVEEYNKISR